MRVIPHVRHNIHIKCMSTSLNVGSTSGQVILHILTMVTLHHSETDSDQALNSTSLKVFTFIRGNDGTTEGVDGTDLPDLPLTADLGELGILSSAVNAAASPGRVWVKFIGQTYQTNSSTILPAQFLFDTKKCQAISDNRSNNFIFSI